MKDLGESKLFEWSASPKEARRRRKMAQKLGAAMETGDKNALAGGYCDGASGGDYYGAIAGREVVTIVLVWWPEADRRLIDNGLK